MKPARDISRLIEIMAALRAPGSGCPWDLEQDFSTIAPYTVEEAYEVADAIERDDAIDLKEELGDLLLQVVYHARLAEEPEITGVRLQTRAEIPKPVFGRGFEAPSRRATPGVVRVGCVWADLEPRQRSADRGATRTAAA